MAGPLSTYYKLRMANPQVQLPGEAPLVMPDNTQQPQPQQQIPQVDTANAIQSLAQLMGPTPAEREAQERRLLENKRKMIAWTGLFDGLRQLGNLYYASKGATPQQYTDQPYKTIEQNYQQERQLNDYLNRYSQAYAQQLYNWKRQGAEDARKEKLADLQQKNYESLIKERGEKTRQQEEKNQAYINYYNALESKNMEQAAYWKAKADGYPDEVAAKIAKMNRTSVSGKSGGAGNTEEESEEWVDNQGHKHRKKVKRGASSSSGNGTRTYDNTRKLGL